MADVEALLVPWLAELRPETHFCTETGTDLQTIPETVQIVRAGGGQKITLANPRIVVHSFAIKTDTLSARQAARTLAYAIDDLMLRPRPHAAIAEGVYVTHVSQTSGPSWVADANTLLRHFVATYSLHVT
jgi:hypothetical protein